MVDLLLAAVAAVVLLGVTVVLVRSERRGGGRTGVLVAVVVLAAGTFALGLYRGLDKKADPVMPGGTASAVPVASGVPSQGFGTAVLRVEVPMGSGDKLPQGALWLAPPRPGTDAYTGDLSLLCSTPGRTEHQQNCTGAEPRVWTVEPLAKRAVIGPATGDPFADPAACSAANGVTYRPGYLELAAGKGYCARLTGAAGPVYALRIPALPAERPLPARIVVEVAVLGS